MIIISSLGFAVPPFQKTISLDPVLNIVYPKIEYIPLNSIISLHFHVYNSSGFLLKNDTVDCEIHVYNSTGNHIQEDNLSFDSNEVDFYIQLNETIVNNEGKYSYIIHCNNSEAGFISTNFEIRKNDRNNPFEMTYLIALLSLLIFVGFIMFFFKHIQLKEHWFLKIFLQFIILFMGFVSLFIGYMALIDTGINAMLQLGGIYIFLIFTILIVLIFYFIYYMVERSIREWK